jgi:hypothetical protein
MYMAFEINDIVVTIRNHLISNLDGIAVYYSECETPQAEDAFIKIVKHIILHGWDEAYISQNPNEFVSYKLNHLLVDPTNQFFVARDDIDAYSNPIIIFFTRYCLLGALLDLYKSIECQPEKKAELKEWFLATKQTLDNEFDSLCNIGIQISYDNEIVANRQEIIKIIERAKSRFELYRDGYNWLTSVRMFRTVLVIVTLLVSAYRIASKEERDVESYLLVLASLMLVGIVIYSENHTNNYARETEQASNSYSFFKSYLAAQLPIAARTDSSMQKFVFVKGEDIENIFKDNSLKVIISLAV